MTESHSAVPDSLFLGCLLLIFLIPFAWAGLALVTTGLNRSRSASHAVFSTLCSASVAMLFYFICGCSIMGVRGASSHIFHTAGIKWDVIGSSPFFIHGYIFDQSFAPLTLLFLLFGVALSAILPIATGAERWRLPAIVASTAIFSGLIFPLFAHWVWGGWLAQLGTTFGLGSGFVDPGGSSCIQATGGMAALSIAWILGPRHGKFMQNGIPTAMPGHDSVIVIFGSLLALIGWIGLNSAGAILFASAHLAQVILVAVNTVLCAASSGITVVAITRIRFGRPDASLSANGFICGLVASSATAIYVQPWQSFVIGIIAGILVLLSIEMIELQMKIDDPAASISVHGIGGIWGILAVGIFGSVGSNSGQFLAQLIGMATLIGFVLPLIYGANLLLNLILPQRVTQEAERQGMDLFELGSGAYPEFAVHLDDFSQR